MTRTIRTLLALLAALALAVSPAAGQNAKLTISGSDTMNMLSQRLAEEYMKAHAGTEISVKGGGSGVGIRDLLEGLNDIAQSSRKIKDGEIAKAKENGYAPVEHIVALDAIALGVHPENPLEELTVSQAKAIFAGAITKWSEIDPKLPASPIVLYSRESNCGTYDFFKEHVLAGANFATNTKYLSATAAIVNSVASDRNAIGFGGVAYWAHSDAVKVLRVKADKDKPAVSPIRVEAGKRHADFKAIQTGAYPISRPLHYYTPDVPEGEAAKFLEWAKGPAGQAIVAKEEYIPLGG